MAGWLFVSVLGGPERPLVASPWPGNCPLVPCPRGGWTAFPAPGARWGPGRAEMDELPGGPAPGHGGRSHRKKGSTFRRPRFTSTRPEVTPQSLYSWPGGHLRGGVHILAPSWSGGGEGRRPGCQPPGDTQTLCFGGGALHVPPPRGGRETRVSPRPALPPPSAPAHTVHTRFSCGMRTGKARALGVYTTDTDTYSRRKKGAFLPQLERHPRWGFC